MSLIQDLELAKIILCNTEQFPNPDINYAKTDVIELGLGLELEWYYGTRCTLSLSIDSEVTQLTDPHSDTYNWAALVGDWSDSGHWSINEAIPTNFLEALGKVHEHKYETR